jgi:dolichol kinase
MGAGAINNVPIHSFRSLKEHGQICYLNNYYFSLLAIGASFFFAIQYITQSGWSAMFKRYLKQ